MKIVFVSNFLNHHQIGFCDELEKKVGISNFYFIAQEPVPNSKLELGYLDYNNMRNYVFKEYENSKKKSQEIIMHSDIIIVSLSQGIKTVKNAIKNNKIIFFYNERLFKDYSIIKSFLKFFRAKYYFDMNKNSNLYFLNASSYGYEDMMKINKRKFKNKCFRFGYFPYFENKSLVHNKNDTFKLLFLGRLIDWKHPEIIFECAKILNDKSIKFHITVVGTGNLYNELQNKIEKKGLSDKISLFGPIQSNETYKMYQQHDIFLFSSDRREGWGAVLNEALYYRCVPLCNIEAGATNFLIKDKFNGCVYSNRLEFAEKLLFLYDMFKSKRLDEMGVNGLNTICNEWNYVNASNRLYNIFDCVLKSKTLPYNGNLLKLECKNEY